jgi:hypothetical protein
VGADDAFDIRYDANDFYQSKLGQLVKKTGIKDKYLRGGDAFVPLATGLGLLPRPEKFYFAFGERISTAHVQVDSENKDIQWQVREQVESAIYGLMQDLFVQREQEQTQWPLWRKKLTKRDE